MDVRLLDNNDTEEAKALWKSAFGDSDEFIETYFRNKILPGNSIGMFDGGLKSVVHMIPYKIRVQGKSLQSAFIAGAATADEYRKKGLMKILLHESLELMRSRGILITHLYPFLHSFYEQFGWATYCYADKKIVTEGRKADRVEQTKDISLLDSMYQNFTRDMDGYVIRSEKEWQWRLDELFSYDGKIFVLYENEEPVCYMMYSEENGKADIIETIYKEPRYAKQLAEHLALRVSSVSYNLMSQHQNSAAHGMARIVDAKGVLEEFGCLELLDSVKIHDDFAQWNNIGNGSRGLSIEELARAVHMGFERALGKAGTQYADILNIYINNRFTCIFEEY